MSDSMQLFLESDDYVNYTDISVEREAHQLFKKCRTNEDRVKAAYEFVRDEIPHSFDIDSVNISVTASDVVKQRNGTCHAKANLLAALLRSRGIPAGFCYQHVTIADDDSLGYQLHCYNAVYLDGRWIKLDARGNTNGRDAQFSKDEPKLAYKNRDEYDEYYIKGIYAKPHAETMRMLEEAESIQDIIDNIPDVIEERPDIEE